MHDRHEADSEFVDRLEWQVGSEVRRRNRFTRSRPGFLSSPSRVALSLVVLVLVSMGFGAAAGAAAGQVEGAGRKDFLIVGLDVQLELAIKRLEHATEEMASVQRRLAIGNADVEDRAMMQLQLAECEARVQELELRLEEVRASGREVRDDVSAPLVDGRDFVAERLEGELELQTQRLALFEPAIARVRIGVDVGTLDPLELAASELARAEQEERVEALHRRLTVRRDFLAGTVTAAEAELLVLIAEAEGRETIARRRFQLAGQEIARLETRVDVGIEPSLALRSSELALAEIEAQLRLVEVELDVLRRELQQQREAR